MARLAHFFRHRPLAGLAGAWASAWASALLLSGCGGGLYLEYDEDDDAYDPVVHLAVGSTSAPAGSSVRLVAAAADESGIDRVVFYRYDGNTAGQLGSDRAAPYEWQLLVPSDGRTSVTVFAHAVDNAGHSSDSEPVAIGITP